MNGEYNNQPTHLHLTNQLTPTPQVGLAFVIGVSCIISATCGVMNNRDGIDTRRWVG